jgi:hypothetical protein
MFPASLAIALNVLQPCRHAARETHTAADQRSHAGNRTSGDSGGASLLLER